MTVDAKHKIGVPQRPSQHDFGACFKHSQHKRISLLVQEPGLRQQIRCQHRRDRERNQQRCQERRHVGHTQRSEHATFKPGHREQRKHDKDHDQRRIHDRISYFAGCIVNNLECVFGDWLLTVLFQSSVDVFDIHDGIIDKVTDGDGDTSQRHRIDRDSKPAKDQHRQQDGHRHRRSAN